jgi:AraC family transcriptional regulator
MRSEYASLPAHRDPTETGPHQVGVAFSGHARLPWESGGRSAVADIRPGSAVVTGADGVTWLRVAEPTEALEIYPDPELLRALAGGPVTVERPVVGADDGVVLGIGSVLRRAHALDTHLSDVAASTLAYRLGTHLLTRYHGLTVPPGPGLLDARTVDRVAAYVDSALAGPITLDRLAAVATLSPYHFARAFKAATGLPPHEFVTCRRIDRACRLLRSEPVESAARAVGFGNLSHFRRVFRRHTGVPPSAYRN